MRKALIVFGVFCCQLKVGAQMTSMHAAQSHAAAEHRFVGGTWAATEVIPFTHSSTNRGNVFEAIRLEGGAAGIQTASFVERQLVGSSIYHHFRVFGAANYTGPNARNVSRDAHATAQIEEFLRIEDASQNPEDPPIVGSIRFHVSARISGRLGAVDDSRQNDSIQVWLGHNLAMINKFGVENRVPINYLGGGEITPTVLVGQVISAHLNEPFHLTFGLSASVSRPFSQFENFRSPFFDIRYQFAGYVGIHDSEGRPIPRERLRFLATHRSEPIPRAEVGSPPAIIPRLWIERQEANVLIRWESDFSDHVLATNDLSAGSNWTARPERAQVNGPWFETILPLSESPLFFRLQPK